MKHVFLMILLVSVGVCISCKKSNDSNNQTQKTPLVFTSLTASDTLIKIGTFTTLTAAASGDELTYTWVSESGYGSFVGSGSVVKWSVCHSDFFSVNCEVGDKYGEKLSKTIRIHAQQP